LQKKQAMNSNRREPDANTRGADLLVEAAAALRHAAGLLVFAPPVTYVYNPLQYAWRAYREYLVRFGASPKRVLFLGMNPGPFGMAQTGIPFGEIAAVRDWMKIEERVDKPPLEHPKRPVLGFQCPRSEVSGRRLWGLFARRFGSAEAFFSEHLVANYCPLAFVEVSGGNRTPDKLPAAELAGLRQVCDAHLRRIVQVLQPEWLIGVGQFAAERAEAVARVIPVKTGVMLHPSPANPAANRDWEGTVTRQLRALGVWD
jgi:single-strand selective monofunctional uracil DNA glycosylase